MLKFASHCDGLAPGVGAANTEAEAETGNFPENRISDGTLVCPADKTSGTTCPQWATEADAAWLLESEQVWQ